MALYDYVFAKELIAEEKVINLTYSEYNEVINTLEDLFHSEGSPVAFRSKKFATGEPGRKVPEREFLYIPFTKFRLSFFADRFDCYGTGTIPYWVVWQKKKEVRGINDYWAVERSIAFEELIDVYPALCTFPFLFVN